MPTTIIIDGVTLTLKKYPEFVAGTPVATDITLFSNPVSGDLFKTTMDNFIANILNVDGVTITGDGSSGNPLVGSGIAGITANNGLIANTATNVQLGGPIGSPSTLLDDRYIDATANFALHIDGAVPFSTTNGVLQVSNSAAFGIAIYGESITNGQGGRFVGNNGAGILGISINNFGVSGQSTNAAALAGVSTNGLGVDVTINPASTNTQEVGGRISRTSSGTPANDIGTSFDFYIQTISGSAVETNRLISKWTNATTATRTSQFIITGVNSAATADLFTLSGSGALQLNKYGVGSFTGTPAYTLQVDASGNVIEGSPGGGGGFTTADNGLTASTATNVQLGGTLIQYTSIDCGSQLLDIFGTAQPVNISTTSNSNAPLDVYSFTSTTNNVIEVLRIGRATSGTAADGFGIIHTFYLESANGTNRTSNQLTSKWTTAADASRTSQLIISGLNNATAIDLIKLNGDGSWQITPITATAASAITPAEGMMLFVSSTDATFTSIGFWGYRNGAWAAF